MSRIKLYSTAFSDWLTGGVLALRSNLSSLGIKVTYNRIMTSKGNTSVWVIEDIPVRFDYNLTDIVRRGLHEQHPDVETMVQYYLEPVKPEVRKQLFQSQMAKEELKYKDFQALFDEMGTSEKIKYGVTEVKLNKLKDTFDSYKYLYFHTMNNGQFFNATITVHATSEDLNTLRSFGEKFEKMMEGYGLTVSQIKGKLQKYLGSYGLATYNNDPDFRLPTVLLSDENLAAISPVYSSGLVGGYGVLAGLDLASMQPLILDFFKTSAAQIFLFVGKSGHGKTLAAMLLILALSGVNVAVDIVDLKGKEWVKISSLVVPLVISLDGDTPLYVSTLRMDNMVQYLDPGDGMYFHNLCISSTVNKFAIATAWTPDDGFSKTDMYTVLEEAVKKVYSRIPGFEPSNIRTFQLTKNLKDHMVLDALSEIMTSSSSITEKIRQSVIPTILFRAEKYFGETAGGKNGKFGEEIKISDILDSRFVIYELNKNTNTVMSTLDHLKVYQARHLMRLKHYIRGRLGLHSVSGYEEFVRIAEEQVEGTVGVSGVSEELLNDISQEATGSRSDNVTTFIMLNSMSAFNNKRTAPIESNVTSVAVGKVSELDRDILVNRFGMAHLEQEIKDISEGLPEFKNAFAIKFDNGDSVISTVYKAVLLPDFEKELRQRDVVELDRTQVEEETL